MQMTTVKVSPAEVEDKYVPEANKQSEDNQGFSDIAAAVTAIDDKPLDEATMKAMLEESMIQQLDDEIADACDDPSIYMKAWILNKPAPWICIFMAFGILLQGKVPHEAMDGFTAEMKMCVDNAFQAPHLVHDLFWVGLALVFYLLSQTLPAIRKVKVFIVMAKSVPAYKGHFLLLCGMLLAYCTICILWATMKLWVSAPDVSDMLLNVVALTFLIDVDVSLGELFAYLCPKDNQEANEKFSAFKDNWEKSEYRAYLIKTSGDPFYKRYMESWVWIIMDMVMVFFILNVAWFALVAPFCTACVEEGLCEVSGG